MVEVIGMVKVYVGLVIEDVEVCYIIICFMCFFWYCSWYYGGGIE